ncbi:hypothetical protein RHGRI_020213 [Rhododendron griersonianum]|uniref:Uncharacterized protein n=1 Tax=Rhododendron griersonianum TaxID=479676 RepID=A0AAV6JMV5_9ERIC|nr:hypothetical protein RHGRI_020213 [Rhododendron griersonianum]
MDKHGKPNESNPAEWSRNVVVLPREGVSVVAGLAAVSKTVWAVAEVTIVEGEKKKKKKHKYKEDGEEGRKRKLEEVYGIPAPHVVTRVKADGDEETVSVKEELH